jgi:hypothetical protein
MAKSKSETSNTTMTQTTQAAEASSEPVREAQAIAVSAGQNREAGRGNTPVRVLRARGVKVAIFENPTSNGTILKATLQRVYRDGADFKTTYALGRDDLPVAAHLLSEAWKFMLEAEKSKEITE